jgi:hypothetical protein
MRRGMHSLALQVQQSLGRDPHAGDLYVFRGVRGGLALGKRGVGCDRRLAIGLYAGWHRLAKPTAYLQAGAGGIGCGEVNHGLGSGLPSG